MNTEDFTAKVVGIVIAVIVIAVVAIPIINGMIGTNGQPNPGDTYPIQAGSTEATILGVIPIFLILAVLMGVVYMFLTNNKKF